MTEKILVSKKAIGQIVAALLGPQYLLRELAVVAGLPHQEKNPINVLAFAFRDAKVEKSASVLEFKPSKSYCPYCHSLLKVGDVMQVGGNKYCSLLCGEKHVTNLLNDLRAMSGKPVVTA